MKKNIRRILLLILAAAMLLSLAACRDDRDDEDDDEDEREEDREDDDDDGRSSGLFSDLFKDKDKDKDDRDDKDDDGDEKDGDSFEGVFPIIPSKPEADAPKYPVAIEDAEGQLAIIAANYVDWLDHDEYSMMYDAFVVTDLDQDGLLEVIFASEGGTGFFTSSEYYEVNEDRTGLIHWGAPSEYGTSLDVITDSVGLYLKDGELHYVFEDYMRSGWAENFTTHAALIPTGTAYREDFICGKRCLVTESDGEYIENYTYYDKDQNEISEESMNSYIDDLYSGCTHYSVTLKWYAASDLANDQDTNALLLKLEDSYNGFTMTKI